MCDSPAEWRLRNHGLIDVNELVVVRRVGEQVDAVLSDLDPFDAGTHGKLGGRLLAKNDAAGALLEFQASLALGAPNPAEAHSDVAEALIKLGRNAEAKREALLALQAAPTFSRAQDLLLKAEGK